MKPAIILTAVIGVLLGGADLTQSKQPDAKMHQGTSAHRSMKEDAAQFAQMKKMGHDGHSASDHSAGSGHQHDAAHSHGNMPSQIDTSTTKPSENGRYMVSITPEAKPVAINAMHSWVLAVTTPDGKPVENADVKVDGNMPRHGHGLPTSPQVTEYLGDGKYLVEGMRFNMAGWWSLKFDIAGQQTDSVEFNLVLK